MLKYSTFSGTRSRYSQRKPRGIAFYLTYAAVLHGLFFGLTAMAKHEPVVREKEPQTITWMESVDPVVEAPKPEALKPETQPDVQPRLSSRAQPIEKLPRAAEPEAAEAKPESGGVQHALESLGSDSKQASWTAPARNSLDNPNAPSAPVDPRSRSFVPGRKGPPRGRGMGAGVESPNGPAGVGVWGVKRNGPPMVSGSLIFGRDRKGALKGSLCFIPPETRSLAAISRCRPAGFMYTNSLNIPKMRFTSGFPGVSDRYEWFAINYNGKFTVKTPGKYTFRIFSDDGSLVWVDDEMLLNNDGLHPAGSKAGALHLTEGSHNIRVFYYQGPRVDIALQLFVTPPGGTEKLWSPEL